MLGLVSCCLHPLLLSPRLDRGGGEPELTGASVDGNGKRAVATVAPEETNRSFFPLSLPSRLPVSPHSPLLLRFLTPWSVIANGPLSNRKSVYVGDTSGRISDRWGANPELRDEPEAAGGHGPLSQAVFHWGAVLCGVL